MKVACDILKDFCYLECLEDFMYGLRHGGLVHSQIIHIDLQWEFRVLSVLDRSGHLQRRLGWSDLR